MRHKLVSGCARALQAVAAAFGRLPARPLAALAVVGLLTSGCDGFSALRDKPSPVASPAAPQPAQPPTAVTPAQGQQAGVPPAAAGKEIKVALLLPLTHKDRNIRDTAKALQDAAQMAIFDAAAQNISLMPRDTGSTPEQAAAAATDALDKGAELILGPLLASDVRAVAPIATQRSIPVIAFSNDRSVAGNGVFLLSFAPEEEVRRIVTRAVRDGRTRFAALIPDNPYGMRVEAAFQKEVVAAGAQIVASERYRPDPQALDGAVKKISRLSFDALLLPDGGTMLRSLAPILFVNRVQSEKVRFLGTTKWDDPTVAQEAALVGGWYVVPPQEQRLNFIRKFEQLYGAKPPQIASLAYDAVALTAALSGGERGKRYTISTITDVNGFAGVDGIFRFLPDGLTERGLAVMEIGASGALKIVEPAPQSFQRLGM
jgi:ABC-type branched-subunit amino acid transport system substrate-binding protein